VKHGLLYFVDRASVYNLFKMKPTGCTLLLSILISTSLHVSDNYVPIIRRTYFIYATLVFFVLCGWLSGLLVGMRLSLFPTKYPQIPSQIPQPNTFSNTLSPTMGGGYLRIGCLFLRNIFVLKRDEVTAVYMSRVGERGRACRVLVRKPGGRKRPLGRPRHR